jgi:hypothetical protein
MNPRLQCCLAETCEEFQVYGKDNMVIHSRKENRYKCRVCKKTFSETKGTAFYRLQKSEDTMSAKSHSNFRIKPFQFYPCLWGCKLPIYLLLFFIFDIFIVFYFLNEFFFTVNSFA